MPETAVVHLLVIPTTCCPPVSRSRAPAFSPTRSVWDMETGKEKSKLEGHTDVVSCVAISPDGKMIVSGSNDQTIR